MVVSAGNSDDSDPADSGGKFLGGLILPGLDLMRDSLARGTADCPEREGRYLPTPDNTNDALVSGAIEATAGAIERASRRLDGAPCLLFGGAAERSGMPWKSFSRRSPCWY